MKKHPDFSREVFCLLGLPFDAVNLSIALQLIRAAATNKTPCFLSTPNLNFLIASQSDTAFRNSVINSDLSIADGMPIVWIARLLGIPIRERVAGSDVFEQLRRESTTRLTVYFFGGIEGVAETACRYLNAESSGLLCVGYKFPGFGSVHDMSSDEYIEPINASGADFLVVSLGAKKGQAWIEHNRARISAPVISHLGAVINFVAGGVDRAPNWLQRFGFEWLWRIKEEPGLWRRYMVDGLAFLKLLLTRVVPYVWLMHWCKPKDLDLTHTDIELFDDGASIIIRLYGDWQQRNLGPLRECFFNLATAGKDVQINMEHVTFVDSAFLGLLILMYGNQKQHGKQLSLDNLKKRVRQIFRLAGAEYLLE